MRCDHLFTRAWIIAICLICTDLAIGAAHVSHEPRPQAVHFRGRVLDRQTKQPLEAARILLTPKIDAAAWRTNANGEFSFWAAASEDQQIEIQCDGYQEISVPAKDGKLQDLRLSPLPLDRNVRQPSGSRNVNLWLPPAPSVAPAIVTADSGAKVSGTGRSWSDWYRLGVGRAPRGYTVQRAEFWLSGDRACGASAECREVTRNDEQVLWEFRLRGHDEEGVPPTTYSVAHIRVLYRAQ